MHPLNLDCRTVLYDTMDPQTLLSLAQTQGELKKTINWSKQVSEYFPFAQDPFPDSFETFKYEAVKQKNWREGIYAIDQVCQPAPHFDILRTQFNKKWWVVSLDQDLILANRTSKQSSSIYNAIGGKINHTILEGDYLLCLSDHHFVTLLDLDNTSRSVYQSNEKITAMEFFNNQAAIGTVRGNIKILKTSEETNFVTDQGEIQSILMDHHSFFSAGYRNVYQYDYDFSEPIYNISVQSGLSNFVANSQFTAVAGFNGVISVNDRKSPHPSFLINEEASTCLEYNESLGLVTASGKCIRVWDFRNNLKPIQEFKAKHRVTCLQSDHEKIVYGDYAGNVVVIPNENKYPSYSVLKTNSAVKNIQFRQMELAASFRNGEVYRCDFRGYLITPKSG